MKSTELRIGNLVNWGVNVCEIKGIHTQTIGEKDNRNHHFYVNVLNNKNMNYYCFEPYEIEPIELNPEWLERFGFENNKFHKECFQHLQTDFIVFTSKTLVGISNNVGTPFYCTVNGMIRPLQYAHDLQNLYFSFTQTELTLKP